jgi:proteasome lid subunit RPN8/RPN11
MGDGEKHSEKPWTRGGVVIARALLDRVFDEARAAYGRDEESCGFLVGPASSPLAITSVVPMENRANKLHKLDPVAFPRTGRMYFDIDPLKFARAIEQGEARGEPVKVLYHSHLDVGAYFSDTDAMAAKMGGDAPAYDLAYLVVSVRAGGAGEGAAPAVDDHKLFVWDHATAAFVQAPLVLGE